MLCWSASSLCPKSMEGCYHTGHPAWTELEMRNPTRVGQLLLLELWSKEGWNLESRVAGSSNPVGHGELVQMVKHLSTMWETWVQSLGWEDSLKKEMATHSSTLALKIPWMEELGAGYYPWGRKESGTYLSCIRHHAGYSSNIISILMTSLQ